MIRGIYTAASGMNVFEIKQGVLANNLANIETPGFKADLLRAEAVYERAISRFTDEQSPISIGSLSIGAQLISEHQTDFSQGRIETTGNHLDFALQGGGFFVVATPEGEGYTRAGNFALDTDGRLVNVDGFPVLGTTGEIVLPPGGTFLVDDQGRIRVDDEEVDQLRVVDFDDRNLLVKRGLNNFFPVDDLVEPREAVGFRVVQGSLERSNMNVVEAMVTMIETLRKFEAAQRAIQSQDLALQRAVNDIARLR
ncbi:MAG TPA: flagellar basal-body rod protein FlgF [Atribacteraceae bacterium]|nr:flagellar basal-body rod protein FlgF [Atribacteraceae bacterium]